MDSLHTWTGLVMGSVLFAVFWMGTLSVFDQEIDRWMAPVTRIPPAEVASLDALRPSYDAAVRANASMWSITLPTDRNPVVKLSYRNGSGTVAQLLDPRSGHILANPGTLGGTSFIYPFHYSLHVSFAQLGTWLVGIAAMGMLTLMVSGVIIHRKIFADFFSLRIAKTQRTVLDLHNVVGVLGLPFHFVITLSGLMIFGLVYFPLTWKAVYPTAEVFGADAFYIFTRPKLDRAGELGSLDTMRAAARREWNTEPRAVQVQYPGDAAAYVSVIHTDPGRVRHALEMMHFDAGTGALLHRSAAPKPILDAWYFIAGMHLIQFNNWTLRWIYFVLGLFGCVMVATGFLFWLESRRKRHAAEGLAGVRVVEGMTIGSVSGIIIATLAFFIANRLLPLGTSVAGIERAALEMWVFYLVWLATFAHAWSRPRAAWREQCIAIAVLAGAAVLLNWVTTGDHLLRALMHRHLWAVAGMDLMLLAGAATAMLMAGRLKDRGALRVSTRGKAVG